MSTREPNKEKGGREGGGVRSSFVLLEVILRQTKKKVYGMHDNVCVSCAELHFQSLQKGITYHKSERGLNSIGIVKWDIKMDGLFVPFLFITTTVY